MEIGSLNIEGEGGQSQRIGAQVSGTEIWFSVSGAPLPLRFSYDPFVLAAFVAAMEEGTGLSVAADAPVSGELLSNLRKAMRICTQWWDTTTAIEICAEPQEETPTQATHLVGCFFSGGLDGLYSFIENEDEITHLILCRGLDISLAEEERWTNFATMAGEFAQERGKELILVETNVKEHLQKPVRADNHGAILVSTALALQLTKVIVPASHALKDMVPWGSHPMLDPLFSNGITRVVHDSPIRRSRKLERVITTGIGLDCLRVCNVYTEDVNCGKCEKCRRTRAAMEMLGGHSPHLPPMEDPRELRKVKIRSDAHFSVWRDNLALATRTGRDDFKREIQGMLRRYRLKRSFQEFDQDYLGGFVRRTKRRWAG